MTSRTYDEVSSNSTILRRYYFALSIAIDVVEVNTVGSDERDISLLPPLLHVLPEAGGVRLVQGQIIGLHNSDPLLQVICQ